MYSPRGGQNTKSNAQGYIIPTPLLILMIAATASMLGNTSFYWHLRRPRTGNYPCSQSPRPVGTLVILTIALKTISAESNTMPVGIMYCAVSRPTREVNVRVEETTGTKQEHTGAR